MQTHALRDHASPRIPVHCKTALLRNFAKVRKSIKNALKLMKKILNKTLKTLLPLLLGAFILYMLYEDFDFTQIWSALKEMDMFWFTATTIFIILSHVIRGLRWKLALAPLGLHPRSSVSIYSIFISYAANLVVPRVGEVSRCVVLEQYDKVPFAQSLGTLVTERLIDTIVVIVMTTVAVMLQWPMFLEFVNEVGLKNPLDGFKNSAVAWIVIILSVIAIAVMLFLLIRKMAIWKKIRSFITRFSEGLLSLRKMKHGWLFVIETLAIWFCYLMQFYLCFFYFPFTSGLSFLAGLLMFVSTSVAVVVPTPNGAGPWHFAVISFMILYGVSSTDASTFAFIVHSTQTIIVALLGIYALIMLQFKKSSNKN